MKTTTLALLATAALAAAPLRADTRIGIGVNFGLPVHRPAMPIIVPAPMPPPAFVAAPPPAVIYAPAPGYWDEVVVKTWVPERWIYTRDHWGRSRRVCEPGYFTYRTERVWVDSRHPHRPTGPVGHPHGPWSR